MIEPARGHCYLAAMQIPPPETSRVTTLQVACDGSGEISPALGHPRVWLQIDEKGYTDCGYCDRRFVLKSAPHSESGAAR